MFFRKESGRRLRPILETAVEAHSSGKEVFIGEFLEEAFGIMFVRNFSPSDIKGLTPKEIKEGKINVGQSVRRSGDKVVTVVVFSPEVMATLYEAMEKFKLNFFSSYRKYLELHQK